MSTKITINTTGDVFVNTAEDSPEPKSGGKKGPPSFSMVVGIRKGDEAAPWNWIAMHRDDWDNDALRRAFGAGPRLCRVEYTLTEVEG